MIEELLNKAKYWQDDNQDRIWERIGKKVMIALYGVIIAGSLFALIY